MNVDYVLAFVILLSCCNSFTAVIIMEKKAHFMRDLEELVMKAESNFHISSALKGDRGRLIQMYEAFSSSYKSLAREMVDDVETMVQVLRSAPQSDDVSAAYSLLNRLKVCFDSPCDYSLKAVISTMIEAAKNRQLTEAQKVVDSPYLYIHFIIITFILFSDYE